VGGDETIGEKDSAPGQAVGCGHRRSAPAGPAQKRAPVRIMLDPDDRPVARAICAGTCRVQPFTAYRVAANDKQGRVALCKYICARPGNDQLKILDDGNVKLELKKRVDGTSSNRPCAAGPHCQVSRDRPTSSSHVVRYSGHLLATASPQPDRPLRRGPRPRRKTSLHCRSRTSISWMICSGKHSQSTPSAHAGKSPLRLIALIETEDT